MEVLHHLANAIIALKKAYDVAPDDAVAARIRAAEALTFRAVRAVADGQVEWAPERVVPETVVVEDWSNEVEATERA